MKLAVLSRNFSKASGGAESYAVSLATAMLPECEVTVICQTYNPANVHFKYIPVSLFPIRSRWMNQLWFNWRAQQLTRAGFDVVHSHENVSHGNVQTVHVKTVHASLKQKKFDPLRVLLSPRLLAYLWLEKKRLCSIGHHNVFVSQLLLDETSQYFPTIRDSTVIPPGVDIPENDISESERLKARETLGIEPKRFVIGFIGHDFKKKGLDVLLKAVALLPFDVDLLVAGRTTQENGYRSLVKALEPGKKCNFLGVQNDMPSFYAALDCLAHPTTQDVFPMVLLEAMAYKVPVLTTPAPFNTMANLLTDGVNAMILRNPNDVKFLVELLTKIQSKQELKQNLKTHGYAFAKQYSWINVKELYYDVFRKAIIGSQSHISAY